MPNQFSYLLAALVLTFGHVATATAEEDPRIEQGREIFTDLAEPQCAICHSLADADASGSVGPNLDTMQPSYDTVMRAITQGIGPMMPYEQLSDEEKDALSHYVSTVAGND